MKDKDKEFIEQAFGMVHDYKDRARNQRIKWTASDTITEHGPIDACNVLDAVTAAQEYVDKHLVHDSVVRIYEAGIEIRRDMRLSGKWHYRTQQKNQENRGGNRSGVGGQVGQPKKKNAKIQFSSRLRPDLLKYAQEHGVAGLLRRESKCLWKKGDRMEIGSSVSLTWGHKMSGTIIEIDNPPYHLLRQKYKIQWDDRELSGWLSASDIEPDERNKMKPIYNILISKLLEKSSEKFSNHGCNELPSDFLGELTRVEIKALRKEYNEWLSEDIYCVQNNTLMDFFADQLKREYKSEKTDEEEKIAAFLDTLNDKDYWKFNNTYRNLAEIVFEWYDQFLKEKDSK